MRINHLELEHAGRLEQDVTFAGARIAHPVVDLSEGTEFIGTPVLRHFELTFDQRTRRVRLHRTDDTAIQIGPRHGTGALFDATTAGLEVVHVIEDSPAELAGLKAGDIVTAVNGQAVAKRSCQTRSPLTDPDSQEVVLTLTHDDEARDVTVPIIELVP